VKKLIAKFWADQSGATAIEYGLIAARHQPRHYRCRQWSWFDPQHEVHEHQFVAEITQRFFVWQLLQGTWRSYSSVLSGNSMNPSAFLRAGFSFNLAG
jgi:Flp/Fap pilin component